MLKKLLISALLAAALPVAAAFAEPPVPKAHSGGDYWIYNEHTWVDWEVTCPELVGRITPTWPEDEEEPGALLKVDWLVPQWPAVARYAKGTRLKAVPDECGGILIKDIDGSSWMKVETPNGKFCFVRANAKFIRPIRVAAKAPVAPPPAASTEIPGEASNPTPTAPPSTKPAPSTSAPLTPAEHVQPPAIGY